MTDETEAAKCREFLNGNFISADYTIAGRVLHCDADFLAYQSANEWESEPLELSIVDIKERIETMRNQAHAAVIVLHLTLGSKGGRYELARAKEYQGARQKCEGIRARVKALRLFMANYWSPTTCPAPQYDQEADDSLTQAMWQHKTSAQIDSVPPVIWSMDKDLKMCGGLHLDQETAQVTPYPWGFGRLYLDRSKTAPKLNGLGTAFFWGQMLLGDTADGILGLPEFTPEICEEYFPTAALIKARENASACDPVKFKAAQKRLDKVRRDMKPKKCGAVAVAEYLKEATTEKEALLLVVKAYDSYYGTDEFWLDCWDGERERRTSRDMMIESGRLLWMRRERGQDVLDYFKEVSRA